MVRTRIAFPLNPRNMFIRRVGQTYCITQHPFSIRVIPKANLDLIFYFGELTNQILHHRARLPRTNPVPTIRDSFQPAPIRTLSTLDVERWTHSSLCPVLMNGKVLFCCVSQGLTSSCSDIAPTSVFYVNESVEEGTSLGEWKMLTLNT